MTKSFIKQTFYSLKAQLTLIKDHLEMSRLTSAWDRSGNQLRQENPWREIGVGLGLFLAGMVLCFVNSKSNGWQEIDDSITSIFSPIGSLDSVNAFIPANLSFPWLIILANGLFTALSVPLLYDLGKETFRLRFVALLSALIYLTFLPVFIHGRMVSLTGLIILLEILLFNCGLRSRRDLRWSLGVGLSAGTLILFNHWVGILFIITLFTFFCWDTPRLITSGYFWLGSILGSVFPLIYYGYLLIGTDNAASLLDISLRFEHFSPLACLKLLLFALPWFIYLKEGGQLAWKEPQWSWAKLVIIWGGIMSVGGLLTNFFDPFPMWLSIYPVFALIGGMVMSYAYQWPKDNTYPLSWSYFLFSLAIMTLMAGLSFYFELLHFNSHLSLFVHNHHILLLMSALMITFLVSGILIIRQNRQFISILVWGLYVSSLLWFNSLHNLIFDLT